MDTNKRSRGGDAAANSNGFKKSKTESDSVSSGIGSKLKPCTKFFSTSGCQFGESCHFLHYVPGGHRATAQMLNLAPAPQASRNFTPRPSTPNGSAPALKSKMCSKYHSAEGCKFGDKCHFAHEEWELNSPVVQSRENHRPMGGVNPLFGGRAQPQHASRQATGFGASSTAKISIDASLVGAIIGKGGMNSKQISRQTGAKLAIREIEGDPNQRNIELEGTLDQIQQASAMVGQLISSLASAGGPGRPNGMGGGGGGPARTTPGSNYKTKLCERFAKGSCTFGDKCQFAHGEAELRKLGV